MLKDQPGWITFTIDGDFAYPSTGDVVDVKTRTIVTELKDENRPARAEREDDGDRFPEPPARTHRRPVRPGTNHEMTEAVRGTTEWMRNAGNHEIHEIHERKTGREFRDTDECSS